MEHRLFDPADPPEWLDPEWWRDRPHCDHLGAETGAHTARLHAAAQLAARTAERLDSSSSTVQVCDLGAGDGALLSLLPDPLRDVSYGYDIIRADQQHAVRVRGVNVDLINVQRGMAHGNLPLSPVVVLTEVLEHMADPHAFLKLLHARPEVRYVVASSPWKETPEQHEWNHAWCWDTIGYERMFKAAGFESLESRLVEWSQLWLFEAVRTPDAPVFASLQEEPEQPLPPEIPPWRAGDPGLRSPGARAAAVQLGFRPDGITDLDPMVEKLLAEGRKAGLP